MIERDEREKSFLLELYRLTEGDLERQVSRSEVGATIGLEEEESTTLAEDLIIESLVELKTLSGGIGITAAGVEYLQKNGLVDQQVESALSLSAGPICNEDDSSLLHKLLTQIRQECICSSHNFNTIEELVTDMKTLEVQLLSPAPKIMIVLSVLRSMRENKVLQQSPALFNKLKDI